MNDQNTTPNEVATQLGQTPTTSPQNGTPGAALIDKAKPFVMDVFNKFKGNKILFWTAIVFFGLVVLIVVIGSIFGRNRGQQVQNTGPTPIPFILQTPAATPGVEILSISRQKLNQLKDQLEILDVQQSRLSPPDINFDIKF